MLLTLFPCWTRRNKSLKNVDRHFNCIACELPKYFGIATCITLKCFCFLELTCCLCVYVRPYEIHSL